MAHSLSAKKRVRQNEDAYARNRWRMKAMREAVKDLQDKILHASVTEAEAAFRKTCTLIDKTAGQGVIHKNTAARKKSRLSARVKAKKLGAKAA